MLPVQGSPNHTEENEKEIFDWFLEHLEHPYPTNDEKRQMALHCGISEKQLNDLVHNTRKRKFTKVDVHVCQSCRMRRVRQRTASEGLPSVDI